MTSYAKRAALASLWILAACSRDPSSPRPTQLVPIEGILVSSSGHLVAGATVFGTAYEGAECGPGQVVDMASTRTGEDGSFTVEMQLLVGIQQCIAVGKAREYPTGETTVVGTQPPTGGGAVVPDTVVVSEPIPMDAGVIVMGDGPTLLSCTPPEPCVKRRIVIVIQRPGP